MVTQYGAAPPAFGGADAAREPRGRAVLSTGPPRRAMQSSSRPPRQASALTHEQGDEVLAYWLAALRLEEALQVRPQARRTTQASAVPRIDQPTPGQDYFKLPLARAYDIFQAAYQSVSGLARTVRGPSMSAFPGKIVIDGTATIAGEKVFVLQFLQARTAHLALQPFFAKFDPEATWLDQLVPAFGEKQFFFQQPGHASREPLEIAHLPATRHGDPRRQATSRGVVKVAGMA